VRISMKKRKIGYVYSSVSGRFPFRGQKSIAFESKLEEAFLTKFAFNDGVLDILEQPFTLEYETDQGKIAHYTPDFLVTFHPDRTGRNTLSSPLLVEVKPREVLQKRLCEFKPKFKAALRYATLQGYVFRIYDEGRIKDTYYQNVKFLHRYIRTYYDPEDERRIIEYLKLSGQSRIDVLIKFLGVTQAQQGVLLGQVWSMLANKKITADLYVPLRNDSVVWINQTNGAEYA